jgi:acyl carrier protein
MATSRVQKNDFDAGVTPAGDAVSLTTRDDVEYSLFQQVVLAKLPEGQHRARGLPSPIASLGEAGLKSNVAEMVTDVVARTAGVPHKRVRLDSRLVDFGIDSIQGLEIVIQLEWIFGIDIPDQDLPKLDSVEDVINYLQQRLAPK